ncbi:hypothetical protein AB5J56_44305 [Streptomyces sp. R21]|uniref:Uncharacterized protein n=1 Tax=Streptomyces sp. R21 TaxID=3238627 RepID=A0AB39PL51_9ACTN
MMFVSRLRNWAEHSVGAAESDDAVVVKTTRYLRLAIVTMVIGLSTAVLYEHSKSHLKGVDSGHCWQHSISAYYYTPVQSVFVGALVAIGISLIALKGSTELEDVFLNFAGILAPVVAFVPTPNVGECGSILTDTTNRGTNISNNVTAVLVMAGVAFLVLGALRALDRPVTGVPGAPAHADEASAHRIAVYGYGLALALYVAAWVVFLADREWFNANAHWSAAITMFVFIWLAVVNNAINFHFTRKKVVAAQHAAEEAGGAKPPKRVNRYLAIALLMPAALVIILATPWFGDYDTIWLEASMIALFAVFWVLQTQELWNHGLRSPDTRTGALQQPQGAEERDAG